MSLKLQEDSSLSEPPGKAKNTGVGSLSLLQRIFPGIELGSPALHADSLPTELPGKPCISTTAILFFPEALADSYTGTSIESCAINGPLIFRNSLGFFNKLMMAKLEQRTHQVTS